MQNPVPTPSVPNGPGSYHCPGWFTGRTFEAWLTMSPPSPTTIVFSSTKFAISAHSRSGWIGVRSLAIHSSICARVLFSSSRSSSSHGSWSPLKPASSAVDRLQERLRVRLDRDVDVAVAAQLDRVRVDLDRRRLRVEALAVAQPEVQRRPDHDDRVRLRQRRPRGCGCRTARGPGASSRGPSRSGTPAPAASPRTPQLLVRLAPVDRASRP